MKNVAKIFSVILCFILFCTSIPVCAAENEFIVFTVETIDEKGNVHQIEEIGYNDGDSIYVPIIFLTKYTLYYYNEDTTTFVRKGQPENSCYGCVQLDFSTLTAKVFSVSTTFEEYTLHNCYIFGEQYFLPLDQMCAFLKAMIKTDGTTVRILNSGYSLADAEYALSLISGKDGYLNFGSSHIIDDIFTESEEVFYISAVKSYFSSIIFGLRVDNLVLFSDIKNLDEYKSFLERCISNNDNYIEMMTTNEDLINRLHQAHNITASIKDKSDSVKDITSVIKDACEPLQNDSLQDALMYVNARDWNALFDTISNVAEYADYYLKLGSMCEDNENILSYFENYYLSTSGLNYLYDLSSFDFSHSDEVPAFYSAINTIKNKYDGNLAKNITTQIGEMVCEEIVDKGIDAALETVIPSTAAIKTVAGVFKLLGYDLTSNAEYDVMIDLDVASKINNYYFDVEGRNYEDFQEGTEEYRISAIFMLLALKQCYISANNLSDSISGNNKLYNDKIDKVDSVLNLFYAAAQSKNFDSFDSISNIFEINKAAVLNSTLGSGAKTISQEEALKNTETYLEATKEEIDEIENFIWSVFSAYETILIEFDCETMTYQKFIDEYLTHLGGDSFLYGYYFGESEYSYQENLDPLKRFVPIDYDEWHTGYYFKYSKDNVDWIATNILNISIDSIADVNFDDYKREDRYYYDGYYYHEQHWGMGDSGNYPTVIDYKRLDDGKYSVIIREDNSFTETTIGAVEAVIALKNIGGKRLWSIYSSKLMST